MAQTDSLLRQQARSERRFFERIDLLDRAGLETVAPVIGGSERRVLARLRRKRLVRFGT